MAKKDKKKVAETPAPEVQEEVLMTTELEPEPEEIQFTDTSYTSASFESLPPIPVEVEKKDKKRKKKKLDDKESSQIKKSVSEIVNWSEESLPAIDSDDVVLKPEEPVEEKPRKGKGKKGKEKEEIPEFEKPKEWKTMHRKERENWMAARIEQWRAEKEAEKQAILAGAKDKRLAYARERNEQLARDVNDQDIRRDILLKTCTLFHRYEREKIVEQQEKQANEEWAQYLRCDGLPDPRVVPQIQTYLHLWEHLTVVNAEELDKRCIEVLPIYCHCKADDLAEAVAAINNDLKNINTWPKSYGLLVNPAQSQLIIVGGRYIYSRLNIATLPPVFYNNVLIPYSSFVKKLGVFIDSCMSWTTYVTEMLEMLEQLVQKTKQFTPRQINNYNEIRLALRAQLSETIQLASYFLLRDLEKYLNMESTKLATYEKTFNGLRLNIWVAIKQPTRKRKPMEPEPVPVELSFPSLKVTVTLPKIIDGSCVCVRAARSMIDLLSESSRSFGTTAVLPNKDVDLFDFNEKELQDMIVTKKQQDDMRAKFFKAIREKTYELERFLKANPYTKNEKEKEDLDNLNMQEPPPVEEPRQCQVTINEKAFKKYLKGCRSRTRIGEINLRKYRICGGTLNLDLITTPPQPKYMMYSVTLTAFQLPKALQPMKYQVQYRAPPPPPPGVTRTPEEIEEENKKIETQHQKLALVFIELPQEVMWTEPPVVCQWQEARKLWTSNYVNDYKFNEDKLTVQFRTGVLWPIGIAVLKYCNMPYQGWDMKPDPHSKGVLITVTGLCVTVTWLCLGNYVRLKFIANSPTSALREHFNKPYSVKRMVQLMREAGCDFFPEFDAHDHVEGSSHKEWVMERHHYNAMAFLSRAYNFQWSRWNAEADSRTMIMQMREVVDPKRESKLSLLHVTPQQAAILKCNEMTQEINYDPMVGFPFYPDLFTLNMSYGSVDARRITFSMKYRLVETVYELLQELKILSFS